MMLACVTPISFDGGLETVESLVGYFFFEVFEEDYAGCSKKNEEMEGILLNQLKKQLKQLW